MVKDGGSTMWFEFGAGYMYIDMFASPALSGLFGFVVTFFLLSLAMSLLVRIVKSIPFF